MSFPLFPFFHVFGTEEVTEVVVAERTWEDRKLSVLVSMILRVPKNQLKHNLKIRPKEKYRKQYCTLKRGRSLVRAMLSLPGKVYECSVNNLLESRPLGVFVSI